jgi:4-amino-4-deoxy-L-arabinose transferase-like glycosyltransferase
MKAGSARSGVMAPPLASLQVRTWLAMGIGAIAFVATRLAALERLPLFTDEGTYLWWGEQILRGDLSRGLGQGKPLMGWLIALGLGLGLDPLHAVRLVGMITGALGLAAAVWLAARWVSPRAALLAGALWLALPYSLAFERIATPDQALGSLALAALALTWAVLHSNMGRTGLAVLTSGVYLLAALCKLPVGLLFAAMPAATVLLSADARRTGWQSKLLRLSLAPAVLGLGVVGAGLYRLASGSRPIGFGLDEILIKAGGTGPVLAHNASRLVAWGEAYLTWPIVLLLCVNVLAAVLRHEALPRSLAGLLVVWATAFVGIANFWVPRYLLPVLPAAIVLTAWGAGLALDYLAEAAMRRFQWQPGRAHGVLYGAALLLLAAGLAGRDRALLFDPLQANWPAEDRAQYVEGAGAGYGLAEAAADLNARLSAEPAGRLVLLRVGDDARLRAYLPARLQEQVAQIHIVGGENQSTAQQIERVRAALAGTQPLYVLTANRTDWNSEWQAAFPSAELVDDYAKPGGQDAVELRQLSAP